MMAVCAGRLQSCWFPGRSRPALAKTGTSLRQNPGDWTKDTQKTCIRGCLCTFQSHALIPFLCSITCVTCTYFQRRRMKGFQWEPSSSSLCISCLKNPHLPSLSSKDDKTPAETWLQSKHSKTWQESSLIWPKKSKKMNIQWKVALPKLKMHNIKKINNTFAFDHIFHNLHEKSCFLCTKESDGC